MDRSRTAGCKTELVYFFMKRVLQTDVGSHTGFIHISNPITVPTLAVNHPFSMFKIKILH